MNHKIIAYNDKVEVWLHESQASYSNFGDDYLESDDNYFIARLTLYKADLLRLDGMVSFAKNAQAQFNDDASGILTSVKFEMPGHIVSAAHLADPDDVEDECYMAELFTFDPMYSRLEIFDSNGIWIRLQTDYDDSFVEIALTDIMDELLELKDKLAWNDNNKH